MASFRMYLNWLYHCYVILLRTNTQASSTVSLAETKPASTILTQG